MAKLLQNLVAPANLRDRNFSKKTNKPKNKKQHNQTDMLSYSLGASAYLRQVTSIPLGRETPSSPEEIILGRSNFWGLPVSYSFSAGSPLFSKKGEFPGWESHRQKLQPVDCSLDCRGAGLPLISVLLFHCGTTPQWKVYWNVCETWNNHFVTYTV